MKRKKLKDEELNFWQPASDMLSALLLIFMLLILLLGLYLVHIPEYTFEDPYAGDTYIDTDSSDESEETDDSGGGWGWDAGGGEGDEDRQQTPVPVTTETPSPSPSPTPTPTPTPDDPGSGGGSGGGDGGGNGGGDGPGETPDEGMKVAVYVMMVDAETDRTIKEPEVMFELYEDKGALQILNTYYPERVAFRSYETTESGTFYFPEKLPVGSYYLHELTEPEGYDAAENQHFVLNDVYDWPDPYVVRVPVYPSRNIVRVQMTDAETGAMVPGGSFDVIADENIITADGTLRYRRGQVASEIEIDEVGYGESEPVYLGRYILRQRDIPDYYAGQQEDIPVEVEKKSNVLPSLYTVENLRTRIRFSLVDELYPTRPVGSAQFRVTADRGSFAPLDVRTDAGGRFVLDELPKGATYRIRQVEASGDYLVSPADYTVSVDVAGYIGESNETLIEGTNRMLRVSLGITDEFSSVQIPNVNLALFDAEDNLIRTWTSSGNAQMFTDLKEGSYYLIKDGDTEKHYDIRVVDQADIQKINIHTTYVLQYVVIGVSIAVGLAAVIGIPAFIRRRRKKKARAQAGS